MPAFGYKRALGFSLIELMVAIAIIAILAGIALPSYQNYVLRSELRAAQADAVALSLAVENVYQRTLSYPGGGMQTVYNQDPDTTEITDILTSWSPSSDLADFTFQLTSGGQVQIGGQARPGYVIRITPQKATVNNCVIVLNSQNLRTMGANDACRFANDGNSWL